MPAFFYCHYSVLYGFLLIGLFLALVLCVRDVFWCL